MSICKSALSDALISARCLKHRTYIQRRLLSQHAPASGAAKLPNRQLISVHGPDTPKFLQGILTSSVESSGSEPGFYSAFLSAQGKVLNDVFIYPTVGTDWQKEHFGDDDVGYLIEADAGSSELLLKHIKRHKLRSKFKLRSLDDGELDVWSGWKDERWTQHTRTRSATPMLTDSRAPGLGQRFLLSDKSSVEELGEVEEVPDSIYTLRRYLRGVPEGQHEIPREESLPMNYNLDLMGAIDFKKGCYIGQELTIRTHHTGVVRRRVLPVQLYDTASDVPTELQYNAESGIASNISGDIKKDGPRKRSSGKLIGSIGNVGLAMCRLEQMSDLSVTSEASTFSAEDKFIVEEANGTLLGVKAFVPDWIRNRIRDPRVQRRVE